MKLIFCLPISLCLGLWATVLFASPVPRRLAVGDTVPAVLFKKLVNYRQSSAALADFKGKVIILDFWAIWCGPCVAGMPVLDSFQQQFAGQLQVIPVTTDKAVDVQAFLKRKKLNHLFSVVEETTIQQYFPHTSVPHAVMISDRGVVVAITTSASITAEVIKKVIAGEKPGLPAKIDLLGFNSLTSLLSEDQVMAKSNVLFQSMITGPVPALISMKSPVLRNKKEVGFHITNQSVVQLYIYASGKPEWYSHTRLLAEGISDISRYSHHLRVSPDSIIRWAQVHALCYEIVAPGMPRQGLLQAMRGDLEKTFAARWGTGFSYQERTVSCLRLVRTSPDTTGFATKGGFSKMSSDPVKETLTIQNIPIERFAVTLEKITDIPVQNATGYTGNLDIILPKSITKGLFHSQNIEPLRRYLQTHGLDLVPGTGEFEMLVIKE